MRIVLVESAPPDAAGSMSRYAALLETALRTVPGVECRRISLAPTSKQLQRVPRRLRMAVHHGTIAWRASRVARRHPADIYHVVDGSHGYIVRSLPRRRTIVTVHDIIPELQLSGRFPLSSPGIAARWIIRTSLLGVTESSQVMADSQSTRHDLVQYAGIPVERINVIPLAVPPALLPATAQRLPDWNDRRSADAPFLLHIGNNGFYKNRQGVIRIFDRVRQKVAVRLKLAGPPPDVTLRNLIRSRGLESLVDFVTDPDDAVVMSLYRAARLLLFPSLYEGFGWPPLEAMAWGCPVVCSEHGSLPEVVSDAALVAESAAEEQLVEHCLSILHSRALADRLVSSGLVRVAEFSLERFREQILAVYRSVDSTRDLSPSARDRGVDVAHAQAVSRQRPSVAASAEN